MNPDRLLKRLRAEHPKADMDIKIDVKYHFFLDGKMLYTWSIYDFFPLEQDRPIPVSEIDDKVFAILDNIVRKNHA